MPRRRRRRRRRRGRADLRFVPQSGPGFSPPVNLIPRIDERGHLPDRLLVGQLLLSSAILYIVCFYFFSDFVGGYRCGP